MPPVTARAKTTPEMPVPPVTDWKKSTWWQMPFLSLPPSLETFWFFIVLQIIRASKPIRICFLHVFLENSRGPREKVFHLDSCVQNVEEDYGTSPLLFTNFQGLVFHSEHRKFPLWGFKMERKNTNQFLSRSKMENRGVQSAWTSLRTDSFSFHGRKDMVSWRFEMCFGYKSRTNTQT